ncbi:MAG: diacylglycerol kinase family protein [Patescibacteria group bacterium]|nr:diacylglycerol kinase family protein [Patescibacteria group bacterium]MDD5490247.1 diacylglycerol kinase family protein [Patescibacteria group bacterium]
MLSLSRFFKSFRYAGRGLRQVFREEQSFRLQILAAILVVILAFYFQIATWQIIVLFLVITLVLVLELINSIFERMVDIIKPGIHEYVRGIKDIMAAAVLLASLAAIIIGLFIFWPYLRAVVSF